MVLGGKGGGGGFGFVPFLLLGGVGWIGEWAEGVVDWAWMGCCLVYLLITQGPVWFVKK